MSRILKFNLNVARIMLIGHNVDGGGWQWQRAIELNSESQMRTKQIKEYNKNFNTSD